MSTATESGAGAGWIGVDGELKRADEAQIGALEGGASVGWGVFTTGAVVRGRPALLASHIERLRGDATQSGLLQQGSQAAGQAWDAGWSEVLEKLIEANKVYEGVFRLTLCARGEGRWHAQGPPRALAAAVPGSLEAGPVQAWLSPYRMDARRPLCGVKSTSYAPWHMMALEARARGCGEAIYRDSEGAICEGARSNLFWRRGLEVCTPDLRTGCLPGIARGLLCSWLNEPGSPWSLRQAREQDEELRQADEIFLCSSTLGPRPVTLLRTDIGGILWQSQNSGQACEMLRERWRHIVEADSELQEAV